MSHSLAELARMTDSALYGDGDCVIDGIETLVDARPGQISFLANSRYRKYLKDTGASAVILSPRDLAGDTVANALLSDDPYLTYARVSACFAPPRAVTAGIHADASVHQTAEIAESAVIGPGTVIEQGVRIGSDVVIGPNCVVAEQAVIAAGTHLIAAVTVCHRVKIGQRCLIHPGVVIGGDGFGLANDKGTWVKIHQLGSVVIGNDVEIGANTTIDRGAIRDTLIGDGVKLDNLIQVAHNVEIGQHTAIAACTGISGSTRIGSHCTLSGGVGLVGHIEIADETQVTGMSMVTRSIKQSGVYSSGIPAMQHEIWQKSLVRMKQLDKMARRLKQLETEVSSLKEELERNYD